MARRLLIALAFLLMAAAPPADCGPARDGQQMCMTRQVCRCAFDPAGLLTGRSPGWRWRCDILETCDLDQPPDAFPALPPPLPAPFIVTPPLPPRP